MVSADQPLKKRKLHETPVEPPPPGSPPRNNLTALNLSDDEIQRRRRNQEEIRSVYEHYKQLKQCIAEKNPRSMSNLEESYLALITASRGCTSVQRILAEFIPRYASFCPTALEAATKVVVNMHNCSLATINRGEDVGGVAYKTAALCISGLVDICQVAQAEAPTSSVIRGICSSVFINVLSFFVSTFDGIELFHIVDKDVLKMQDSTELYSEFNKKLSAEDELAAVKLSKLRALSLLWIFFSYPKNTLAASFELFDSTASEEIHKCGLYFLRQVTTEIQAANDSRSDGIISAICSDNTRHNSKDITDDGLVLHGDHISDGSPLVLRNCLLGMVVCKYPSLKSWIIARYKKFCTSASLQVASEITSLLEGVFQSFADQVKAADDQVDSTEDNSSPSNNISAQYLVPKSSKRHDNNSEISGRDGSYVSNLSDKFSGQKLTDHRSSILPEAHMCSNIDIGGPRSMEFDTSDTGEVSRRRSSTPRDVLINQVSSPITRKSFDMNNNSFEGSVGHLKSPFESPQHHMSFPYASPGHVNWFSDGDPATMDIFSASRRLWLGSLGPDASEALVRFQFENFGPTEQFLYNPSKGFASVEYKSIMDAVRARKSMKGCSPWGAPLQVKFLDIGLGTRGTINGVAVGSCCHVYIGNVSTQWAKDEILHEIKKVLYSGPLMITDLPSEMALLMEFKGPEEATNVMAHLRQWRKDNSNYHLPSNAGPANVRMHMETSRPGPTVPSYFRSNFGNSVTGSPNSQTVLENPAESYSYPGKHQGTSLHAIHDSTMSERMSQTISPEIHQNTRHPFHLNWTPYGCSNMPQAGPRVCSTYDKSMVVDYSQGGGHGGSGASEQMWMYNIPQIEVHSAPGSHSYMATATQGPPITQPQSIHASPSMRPYFPLNNSWDSSGLSHPHPSIPGQAGVIPSVLHTPAVPPPFRPASVTPLTQIQGSSVQQYDQAFSRPAVPPLTTLLPQPGMAPPLPPPLSSPPPLPLSLPPLVPPPPSSPPPLPPRESSNLESSGQSISYRWQGTLSKSGVQYCTVSAQRLHSDICNYSNATTEPAEWPAKLDMTKRTDFRHVRSTFSSTPAYKREVCQLLPSSAGDYKGFQDFISYLKQRECAGVIKIPAIKPMWARLLFILPYSSELSAMLSITPTSPQDCLIALVLPKETNYEWV